LRKFCDREHGGESQGQENFFAEIGNRTNSFGDRQG